MVQCQTCLSVVELPLWLLTIAMASSPHYYYHYCASTMANATTPTTKYKQAGVLSL